MSHGAGAEGGGGGGSGVNLRVVVDDKHNRDLKCINSDVEMIARCEPTVGLDRSIAFEAGVRRL